MKKLSLLVFLFLLIKVLLITFSSLPLCFDEAYYWDWSRFPDWGYFSKPPMVAWLIALSTHLFGINEFAVRFPAILCYIITLVFSFKIFKQFSSDFTNSLLNKFLLFFVFLPILNAFSLIFTIDPPFITFWVLSTYFFLNFIKEKNFKNAFFTGLFIGLGLLSKQTMISFLLFISLYALLKDLSLFKNPHFWIISLLPFLIYFPNIWWNFKHQMVLLHHTESHFTRKAKFLIDLLIFLAGCSLAYTPMFFEIFRKGQSFLKKLSLKKSIPLEKPLFFLLISSFFPLTIFLFLELFIRLEINWIFPFVISGFFFIFSYSFSQSPDQLFKKFLKLSLILGAAVSFLFHLIYLAPEKFPMPLPLVFKHFLGWKEVAKKIEKNIPDSLKNLPYVAENRKIAAEMAFYLKNHPYFFVKKPFNEKRAFNQYHLWRNTHKLCGKEVLYFKNGKTPPSCIIAPEFLSLGSFQIGNKILRQISVWAGIYRCR